MAAGPVQKTVEETDMYPPAAQACPVPPTFDDARWRA